MNRQKKIGEHDLTHATLDVLNQKKGYMTTSDLKEAVKAKVNPSGDNLKPLKNRRDKAIDQIIGNTVSHRKDSKNNIIHKGFVEYAGKETGLKITETGEKYLERLRTEDIRKKLEES